MGDKKGLWVPLATLSRCDLSLAEKCIFTEIEGLAERVEGCSAKNNHFIELFGISRSTTSRAIKKLSEKGMIEVDEDRSGFGVDRTIYVSVQNDPCHIVKMTSAPSQNDFTPSQNDYSYKGEKNKRRIKKKNTVYESEEFKQFYESYPKKQAKVDAQKAFKAAKNLPNITELIEIVERWKETEQWSKDKGQFVPLPASWIRQERWLDDLPAKTAAQKLTITPALSAGNQFKLEEA